jgi:shikimate 5-dehydrogenase
MLIEQAALSFDIWNDFKPNTIGLEKTLGLR